MNFIDLLLQNPILLTIDLLIVTYLIYLLIKFARQTRAMGLLVGVLIVVATKMLSDVMRLYALSFVIDQVITWGVMAIIVIFQPEIRRTLEQLGSTFRWQKDSVSANSQDVVEQIVEATQYLSKRYIGALICLENQSTLERFAKTGVPLKANLSAQLLMNMFTPNTPLHDGAVIVSKKTILAASCVLPLTEKTDLPQELGTRHRAALGLSEHTDAFTIVVSEETGNISVAFKNELYRRLTIDELERMLILHVYPTQTAKKVSFFDRLKELFGGDARV